MLKAAVMGQGWFGVKHAEAYKRLERSGSLQLVGVVDIVSSRARQAAGALGVEWAQRAEDLPSRPEVASVAVPSHAHLEVAQRLLEAGVHCLIEKPVGGRESVPEALEIAASRSGAKVQVGFVERFSSAWDIANVIGSFPIYVETVRCSPPPSRDVPDDVVRDLMIHDLDLIHRFVPHELHNIQVAGSENLKGPIGVRLEFDGGFVARLTASRCEEERVRRVNVFANEGVLAMDLLQHHSVWRARSCTLETWLEMINRRGSSPSVDGWLAPVDGRLLAASKKIDQAVGLDPLARQILALVNAIEKDLEPEPGLADARAALNLANRILPHPR